MLFDKLFAEASRVFLVSEDGEWGMRFSGFHPAPRRPR